MATVLIVDDDPQILRLVEKMLRARKATIRVASTPSEAIGICEREAVDLLITDVSMPEMNGYKLADTVLKLRPQARVLVISGEDQDPAKRENRLFLPKPFFPAQLLEALKELLRDLPAPTADGPGSPGAGAAGKS